MTDQSQLSFIENKLPRRLVYRRKSCYCTWCGGLPNLQKEIQNSPWISLLANREDCRHRTPINLRNIQRDFGSPEISPKRLKGNSRLNAKTRKSIIMKCQTIVVLNPNGRSGVGVRSDDDSGSSSRLNISRKSSQRRLESKDEVRRRSGFGKSPLPTESIENQGSIFFERTTEETYVPSSSKFNSDATRIQAERSPKKQQDLVRIKSRPEIMSSGVYQQLYNRIEQSPVSPLKSTSPMNLATSVRQPKSSLLMLEKKSLTYIITPSQQLPQISDIRPVLSPSPQIEVSLMKSDRKENFTRARSVVRKRQEENGDEKIPQTITSIAKKMSKQKGIEEPSVDMRLFSAYTRTRRELDSKEKGEQQLMKEEYIENFVKRDEKTSKVYNFKDIVERKKFGEANIIITRSKTPKKMWSGTDREPLTSHKELGPTSPLRRSKTPKKILFSVDKDLLIVQKGESSPKKIRKMIDLRATRTAGLLQAYSAKKPN